MSDGSAGKRVIKTSAPTAGPYSPAVGASGLCFVSGQVGYDAAAGRLAEGVEAQTRQAIANLASVLADAGLGLADVVKTTVFMTDLADFATMNSVFGEFFDQDPPARSTVQVAALPMGASVEVEAVAAGA